MDGSVVRWETICPLRRFKVLILILILFFFFNFLKVVAGDLDKIVLILWTLVHLVVYLGEQAKAAMFHAVANLSLFSFILA